MKDGGVLTLTALSSTKLATDLLRLPLQLYRSNFNAEAVKNCTLIVARATSDNQDNDDDDDDGTTEGRTTTTTTDATEGTRQRTWEPTDTER